MSGEDQWDIVLDGVGYMLDRAGDAGTGQDREQSVQMLRQQADTSGRPGEESLNPAGLWPRAQESWHHGAGQDWLDRIDGDPFRFDSSVGVDVWDKYHLSLLNDILTPHSSANTNLYLAVAGGAVYCTDGQDVYRSTNGTSWTICTGLPAVSVSSICSDGTAVYVSSASGGHGIWTATGTAFTQLVTNGDYTVVRYVKSRLMGGSGVGVYNITSAVPAVTPTALMSHANPSWVWTDFAEGPEFIYASGYAADHSAIYKTQIAPDATALTAPTHAASLPDGEIVRCITGYLGFLVIGTDTGVRFAAIEADGSLTVGARIPTTSPVLCLEGQDRFVWYGLTNYTYNIPGFGGSTSTGLGRMDLTAFTSDLTPAFASDLMRATTGSVQSVVTFGGVRMYTISGRGVVFEHAGTPLTVGYLTSSRITYGIAASKTAIAVDVRHARLTGSGGVTLWMYADDDTLDAFTIGTSNAAGTVTSDPAPLPVPGPLIASYFQWVLQVAGDAEPQRITLLADPDPDRTEMVSVPIMLRDRVLSPDGTIPRDLDVLAEKAALRALFTSRRIVPYLRYGESRQVVLDDYTWVADNTSSRPAGTQGTFIATLKSVG